MANERNAGRKHRFNDDDVKAMINMLKSGKHPGELKDAVCTPGGTTIEGISALEEKGFRNALIYAVDKVMEKKHSM